MDCGIYNHVGAFVEPEDVYIELGQTATITCNNSDTTEPPYWKINGFPPSNLRKLREQGFVYTDRTLHVPMELATLENDGDVYQCVFPDTGVESRTATLRIVNGKYDDCRLWSGESGGEGRGGEGRGGEGRGGEGRGGEGRGGEGRGGEGRGGEGRGGEGRGGEGRGLINEGNSSCEIKHHYPSLGHTKSIDPPPTSLPGACNIGLLTAN